ncbi:hypothetical protein [Burkholderia glumae]|uniref:hypothetical protein n=1 Tax=Burkholderia glumae TaxID=337 RepID=UPI0011D25B48|nr:hypothetical protein [Burkholderia glumae]MCM2549402.1 hypothetical protein [Burkholderia glumae]
MATTTPKIDAFTAARKQVEHDMAGFLQRMHDATQLSSASKQGGQSSGNKGSQQNKAKAGKR